MAIGVLLATELGHGLGHVGRLGAIAARLRAEGISCAFAGRDLARISSIVAPGETVYQAPVWPGFFADRPESTADSGAIGLARTLGAFGLATPGAFPTIVAAWTSILDAARPGSVIADFAPGLLVAARGRVQTIAVGTGFTVPEARQPNFASMDGNDRTESDADVLDAVNAALAASGRQPLRSLPELFLADVPLPATYSFFDPYSTVRTVPLCGPLDTPLRRDPAGRHDNVFVYLSGRAQHDNRIMAALAGSPASLVVHIPGSSAAMHEVLTASGLRVLDSPFSVDQLAGDAAAIVHSGGHGLAVQALALGLPQVVIPDHAEQCWNAVSLGNLGLAIVLPRRTFTPSDLDVAISRALSDLSWRRRAAEKAEEIASDPRASFVAKAVEAVLGGWDRNGA